MRITQIDAIRFGHFVNRRITFPVRSPDFYVIYGDNEAGKSTMLRAISSLLFGVPARSVDTHSCKTAELRIGATIAQNGKDFTFRRRKGTSGTLLDVNDAQIADSNLASFLRELDRDRFEQFFGLSHERLRTGGDELLRGKGDVGTALFQAAGLLELRKVLKSLDSEASELFSPKSRTKVINCAIDDYRKATAQNRSSAVSASAVKQKQDELEAAKSRYERLKTESNAIQQEFVRLRRIATNKPDIARLQELRRALGSLAHLPALPIDARRQRDDAAKIAAEADRQIDVLNENIRTRRDKIAALQVSSILKSHTTEIKELSGEVNDYRRSINDHLRYAKKLYVTSDRTFTADRSQNAGDRQVDRETRSSYRK